MIKTSKFFALVFLGWALHSTPVSAIQNIQIQNFRSLPFDKNYNYDITGAFGTGNHFFAVSGSSIYQLTQGLKPNTTSLLPFEDLKTFSQFYTVTKATGRLVLEGVTSCNDTIYVVNQGTRDLIKVQNQTLQKIPVSYEQFPDYKYEEGSDGFIGISADCDRQVLYVAKQKNPNKIFFIDLKSAKVVNEYDLTTGSDTEDNVSDLYFSNGLLYILQKNINSILVMDPMKSGNEAKVKRYDYSIAETITKDANHERGIAEGLVVVSQQKLIYLFLDSKNVIVELKI